MKNRLLRFTPLFIAIAMVLGILIGSFYANHFSGNRLAIIATGNNKISDLIHLINDQYVDSISVTDLVEKAVPKLIKELDPHSTYIPAKDAEASMQELQGSFQGIGVQFSIQHDTVCILKIIKGGPSEHVGLRPGDRIVTVNDSLYVGKVVSNEETLKRLKGPRETEVKLGIKRNGEKELLTYVIKRGDVPLRSIDATYMVNDEIGYIRITNFAEHTYAEFLVALAKLQQENFQSLIIDLRGNVGGYMHPAILIANEFLPINRLVVYTEGLHSPREEFHTDGRGMYVNLPLVVLVDEGSASASEILAGALQDNDRATIVGRRTFGKGLVQIPIEFRDGSMLRLTTARYYTPSGRCVQKPYAEGNPQNYDADLVERALHGEYFYADSIKISGDAFTTIGGRTVYGGGGIIPDHFIARDTLGMTSYLRDLYSTAIPHEFTFNFVDTHREAFSQATTIPQLVNMAKRLQPVQKLVRFAEKRGIKRRNLMIKTSFSTIERYQLINIIDQVMGIEAAAQFENIADPAINKAISLIQQGEAFPTLPNTDESTQDSIASTIAATAP